jgi:hypothetical protein
VIKVQHWVYRIFWVACLFLGLLLAVPFPLLLIFGASVAVISQGAVYALIASELLGVFLILFSIRRLARPLRAET